MTKSVGRRIVRVLVTLWRISLVVGASTFVVGGIRILTGGPDCRGVRFGIRAHLVLYQCVADPGSSSAVMSSGAAALLALGLGVAMLTLATLPFWRGLWYRRGGGGASAAALPMATRLPPVRVPVVMPAAARECPWCAATIDTVAVVCRSCGCEVRPIGVQIAPPADEWTTVRATHPHAFGPVLHAAEKVPKEQWPADAKHAVGRACVLFASEGLDANAAVRRAFEEARFVPTPTVLSHESSDDQAGVRRPPRLPPR
jgi:hypothetical protein